MKTKSWEAKIPKTLPVDQRTKLYKVYEIQPSQHYPNRTMTIRSFVGYKELTNKQVTLHILKGYIVEQSFDY